MTPQNNKPANSKNKTDLADTNKNDKEFIFALAGNANVGKSVIFNQLTGSNQIIGNWPGKTVDRAEGVLNFEGYEIKVIDLPGIYSFSTFSMEELVSRDYIALEKPDAVINVVDASVLERNLFFTLQLLEMNAPLVLVLNQIDVAKNKGIIINKEKLSEMLGVPVVFTTATRGEGIYEAVKEAVKIANSKPKHKQLKYHKDLEEQIDKVQHTIEKEKLFVGYPSRWVAIKLLEGDIEITKLVAEKSEQIIVQLNAILTEFEKHHQEKCFSTIASERYALASSIVASSFQQEKSAHRFTDKLDWFATHRIYGYITALAVIGGLLLWTFFVGNTFSDLISQGLNLIYSVDPEMSASAPLLSIIFNGFWGGINAGLTLIIPFVIPFYLLLALIEDSGLLTRVAFMMDSIMHKIGLHGKALIPIILGYGCSVPAIHSCKIMETRRERLLAAFAITFAPCSARTIVLFGMVGLFVGIQWALLLYVVNLVIIFVMGRVAMKAVPGKSTGLIMEMSSFKRPSIKIALKQTWIRTKSIIYVVFPIYIIGSALIQVLYIYDILTPISNALYPLTVLWLGLPAFAGVLLLLGTVRKELIILGASAILGTTNLLIGFTPIQLVVMALVAMLYIPCVSTIAILGKEFGWKSAALISLANIGTALILGGLTFHILNFFI
ncbi:MAG: ferrous iron transport protein B [Candidatus Bathyarchaeota archaeon]|uniref:ferrous iron transport protein B n=1 Tax=Candidatus Bathycorpusculum sp. TaxID=2994959 RepID=UPI0028361442|nr:ferrous iron transport protein B [Candidatus Termiticorpusculum sp.]MCL2258082.1 ferrous iron transport protein B [Candidatus Termiticorpusculum sp.]MCL2291563.1 ferrous iron transport protein B [Candidatus Termiticorpusculum sp.]